MGLGRCSIFLSISRCGRVFDQKLDFSILPKRKEKVMIDIMPSEKGRAKLLKAKTAAKKRREKERKDDRLEEREVDPVKEAKASVG